MIKKTIKNFTILSKIGEGGVGEIYLAQNNFGITNAIKMLRPCYRNSKEMREKFLQECHIMQKLSGHPNTAQIFDLHEQDGQLYLFMEDLSQGVNMLEIRNHCSTRMPDKEQITAWLADVVEILSYAANLNPPIMHGDIKPNNIIMTKQGQIKLIDFGSAHYYKPENLGEDTLPVNKDIETLNKDAKFYMSPEKLLQLGNSDLRSDIYSLGKTFLRIATLYDDTSELEEGILKDFIEQSTEYQPLNRYQDYQTIKEILGIYTKDLTYTHISRMSCAIPNRAETTIVLDGQAGISSCQFPSPYLNNNVADSKEFFSEPCPMRGTGIVIDLNDDLEAQIECENDCISKEIELSPVFDRKKESANWSNELIEDALSSINLLKKIKSLQEFALQRFDFEKLQRMVNTQSFYELNKLLSERGQIHQSFIFDNLQICDVELEGNHYLIRSLFSPSVALEYKYSFASVSNLKVSSNFGGPLIPNRYFFYLVVKRGNSYAAIDLPNKCTEPYCYPSKSMDDVISSIEERS